MKFEVRYPGGSIHEVVLEGGVAVVGRDPSCDLVINDPKCSRRHAVVEAGPDGLVIRDTGSANGIAVNGVKTERSLLRPGDVFRIGDVDVAVLAADEAGTLVMDGPGTGPGSQPPHLRTATLPPLEGVAPPGDTGSLPPSPRVPGARPEAGPPQPPPPRTAPPARRETARSRGPSARPLTISVLSVLWVLSIPFHAVTGIALAQAWPGLGGSALAVTAAILAIVGGLMSFGLWTAQGWARPAQIALAAVGVLNCPFALASIAVLIYMLRPQARRYFAHEGGDPSADQSEAVFAAAVVAAVVLGGLLTAGLTIVARTARTGPYGAAHSPAAAPAAVALRGAVGYKPLKPTHE